jgi:hypothetical protein
VYLIGNLRDTVNAVDGFSPFPIKFPAANPISSHGNGIEGVQLMDWVEHRARRDQYLDDAVEEWRQVRSAVQQACKSYIRHYAHTGAYELQCNVEHDNRLVIERTLPADDIFRFSAELRRVVVVFSNDQLTIEASSNFAGQDTIQLCVSSDDDGTLVTFEGTRLSHEEASRRILEHFLFPTDERRRPI